MTTPLDRSASTPEALLYANNVLPPTEAFPQIKLDREVVAKMLSDRQSNEIHHMPAALPEDYCHAAVAAAKSLKFTAYEKTEGSADYAPILKYGPTVFDYTGGLGFADYFHIARIEAEQGSRAFAAAAIANPRIIALRALSAAWEGNVGVAVERGRHGGAAPRNYFAGVMRDIPSGALPHVDDAAIETPELEIGGVVAQASLLFYLDVPTEGGALRVYDKTAARSDWAEMRGYGFSPKSIAGRTFAGVTPTVGSVVLFRTTQIHSVDPVIGAGRRITWSTFIGLTKNGDLILWS